MIGRLSFLPGSPFSRMARVLVREWGLPVEETEEQFPMRESFFEENPLGQVPVLNIADQKVFPTFLVLEKLWQMAGSPEEAYRPQTERQILLTTLHAGDALAAAFYQGWSGLGLLSENHIGYDPADRNLERVGRVLSWLDARTERGILRKGMTIPGVALSAIVLWADARGGLQWRHHKNLAELVSLLEGRPSFTSTLPQKW